MIDRIAEAARRDVSRETFEKLEKFCALLVSENENQNLISRSTIDELWERHVVDAAQLLRFSSPGQSWCDMGTGPGLPGVVLAILSNDPVMLVEPRRKRVDFLDHVLSTLGLINAKTVLGKVEKLEGHYDILTARAVAGLTDLFGMASHLAHSGTKWVLPKGAKAKSELDEASRTWQGTFELAPSLTSPDASIIIATGVQPRGKR